MLDWGKYYCQIYQINTADLKTFLHLKGKYLLQNSFILIFIAFTACNEADVKKVEALTRNTNLPVETAKNVEFTFSDSAILKARIITPCTERYATERPYLLMPKGLNVTFYDNQGTANAFMRADYGIRYLNDYIIEVKKNVMVVNLKGDTLTSEHLIWDERKEKVYSKTFVRVKTADEIIKSEGFESDPYFSHYTFYNIKGIISLKEEGKM